MKKSRLISILTISLFLSFPSLAQVDLKLNASSLLSRKPAMSIEFGREKLSVELGLGYNFRPWSDATVNGEDISIARRGVEALLKGNYYFNPQEDLDGFHVSPYLNYKNQKISFDKPVRGTKVGLGVFLGRKGLITERLGYQVELGFGYNLVNKYKEVNSGNEVDISENIPFVGNIFKSLDKVQMPLNINLFYRLK